MFLSCFQTAAVSVAVLMVIGTGWNYGLASADANQVPVSEPTYFGTGLLVLRNMRAALPTLPF